ncbi:hypothetical protein [Synechococcus sp. O70.2]|jgi:hypothetical protein|uniref:hypothetical protein n=1 Tax=unclassified Synechococcus TaxID=2626047 RepID=UPI0039C30A66
MSEELLRAIRKRDLEAATLAVQQLRSQWRLSEAAITSMVMVAVERLAWDEGDRAAARWLLRRCSRRRR